MQAVLNSEFDQTRRRFSFLHAKTCDGDVICCGVTPPPKTAALTPFLPSTTVLESKNCPARKQP